MRGWTVRWLLAGLIAVLLSTVSVAVTFAAPDLVGSGSVAPAYTATAYIYDGPDTLSIPREMQDDRDVSHLGAGQGVIPQERSDIVRATGVAAKAGPSAQEIIQSTARAQAARGSAAIQGSLSGAERAAMAADSRLTARMLGQGVHRSTANALEQAYPGRFLYSTRGPDFVDMTTGEMLELTTRGQVGSHLARPGYSNVTMCTYALPAC